jgi:N-acetylmuramoyl-L-alanine amidase
LNENTEKYKNWFIIGAIVLVVIFVLKKLNFFTMITDIINQLPHKGEYRQRSLESIDKIVIHHSASPSGKFNLWDFAKWHIDPAGRLNAPRIAYHFGIEPDGKIYQTNKLTSLSWHAPNANTNGIGIVLNGNFENEKPTDAQVRSLKKLIRYLNGKLGKKLAVYGHREIKGNSTACPGRNVNLDEFRNLA